ncbi:hypothetical protein Dsin_011089 [Dipteronia sinensis]|uniref:Heme oxygenase n=1 Tax=Dipteronia sinensis TaxID=43782 RepID=A0AAE0EDG6_9ROSI|nr:hypothetical protein Dsin_011089 [Dipteronia sinensis]
MEDGLSGWKLCQLNQHILDLGNLLNTGLEREGGVSKDLEWFSGQGVVIPEPSTPGVSYAKYLEELAERSAPLFLSHFYNIYFSHIAGGQVIAKQLGMRKRTKKMSRRGMETTRRTLQDRSREARRRRGIGNGSGRWWWWWWWRGTGWEGPEKYPDWMNLYGKKEGMKSGVRFTL